MKFSTKTTYGLRSMINLAKKFGQGSVPLSMIAREEDISQKYLERLFSKLKKSNLIFAEKGTNGGYTLAQKPEKISILEIVNALEGKLSLFHCLSENEDVACNLKCNCGATEVLLKVQQAINDTLKKTKLSDLV